MSPLSKRSAQVPQGFIHLGFDGMDGDLHPDGDFSIGEFLVTTFKKYLPAAVRKLGYGFRNQSRQLFSLDLHLTRPGENIPQFFERNVRKTIVPHVIE